MLQRCNINAFAIRQHIGLLNEKYSFLGIVHFFEKQYLCTRKFSNNKICVYEENFYFYRCSCSNSFIS